MPSTITGSGISAPSAGVSAPSPPKRKPALSRCAVAAATTAAPARASLATCTVRDPSSGAPTFVPPYAHVNATAYDHMTESFEASYANFRFYSEVLLADVMPREVESLFLEFHNARGGRLGGASRWQDHLDDMPTAGWGYGALTNNRTDDFLALLYGRALAAARTVAFPHAACD